MNLMILFFSTQALNARIWELVRRNPVDNGPFWSPRRCYLQAYR